MQEADVSAVSDSAKIKHKLLSSWSVAYCQSHICIHRLHQPGQGPSEQWCYDVIVSVTQPWYDLFVKMFCRILWVSKRRQQTACYCGELWTVYRYTSTTRN